VRAILENPSRRKEEDIVDAATSKAKKLHLRQMNRGNEK
jgi:hypothetical protein